MLNLGQAAIIAIGLALVMLMAANGVQAGTMTVGKFVLVNTYLMQLYQPLNFLGFVYREIKQGLVDMESMFRLMSVDQEVADRPGAVALPAAPRRRPPGSVTFRDVHFGYNPEPRNPQRRQLQGPRRRQARHRRPHRRRQIHHLAACCSASTTSPAARWRSTAPTSAT